MSKQIAGQEMLGRQEMLALLGVSDPTLRQWVRRRILPSPVRIGHSQYWFREAVEAAFVSIRAATERNVRKSSIEQSLTRREV